MELSKETEYTLSYANQRAVVSPFGASLRRYFIVTAKGEWNAVWGYSGSANKKGGQGDVLIPFPGRIKNGVFEFTGTRHELAKNDKDGPNAIHGFLRTEMYGVETLSETKAVFKFEIRDSTFASRGFPFSLDVKITYELDSKGLTTSFNIKNVGEITAPVGVGFHPYFCADAGTLESWSAQIPADNFVELENLIPTGRILSVEKTALDLRIPKRIGNDPYNACLTQLTRDSEGFARATLQAEGSKNRVILALDKSFDYIVIYTGDQIPAPHQRQAFAIEPMTCAPDAFNHEGWGTKALGPYDTFTGSYTIRAEVI